MKIVDVDEPTSFLDHVYLGCTQRECKANEITTEETRRCSNREFLLDPEGDVFAATLATTHETFGVPAMYAVIQSVSSMSATRRTTGFVMGNHGRPFVLQGLRRAHDADPVRDDQRARHVRGDPGRIVSFRFWDARRPV